MKQSQKLILLAATVALFLLSPRLYGGITFTSLISFDGTNGANPVANLVQGKDGNFYGTTPNGGAYGNGAIFEISADGSFFTNVYNFTGGTNGSAPAAPLIVGADGNFYGTTYSGGVSNWGTIFQLSSGGDLACLGMFSGTNGANPDVALVQAADGSFYGATKYGGPYPNTTQGGTGYGVIFRITTNGVLSNPFMFDGTNGANSAALVLGADGNFYGTTAWGGSISQFPLGYGTIFRLGSDGTFTNLYTFSGFTDGGFPYANLVQAGDGNFYGTAFNGGAHNAGDVFGITPEGQFTNLYSFTGGSDGYFPYSGLVQGSDGNLYGTSYGYFTLGTIFQITTSGNLTPLVSFTGTSGSYPGAKPQGSLVQGTDGNFYGTTPNGGAYNDGTVFRLSLRLPPVFKSVTKAAGMVTLVWSTVATQTYQLQYSTNLTEGNWNNLGGAAVATSGTMTAFDSVEPVPPQRFYRVILQ